MSADFEWVLSLFIWSLRSCKWFGQRPRFGGPARVGLEAGGSEAGNESIEARSSPSRDGARGVASQYHGRSRRAATKSQFTSGQKCLRYSARSLRRSM